MVSLVIHEFGYILPGEPMALGKDCVRITLHDFEALKHWVLAEKVENEVRIMRVCSAHGSEALQDLNYCGVIKTSSGIQIEILPKIYAATLGDDQEESVRALFLKMLAHFHDLPFRKIEAAMLEHAKHPLLEFFIRYFLDCVTDLIKRGIRSDYVQQEGNLNYLKGKLDIPRHIHFNTVHRQRFYVRYDEFLPDRPENRLIHATLKKVAGLTRLLDNQRLCREHLFTFQDIPCSRNHPRDFKQCRKDRNMAHYEEVMTWCAMLLNNESPLPQSGDTMCVSLLFPMEKVFEYYVAAMLKRQFEPEGWKVSTQVSTKYLVENHNGNSLFNMRPDLVLTKNGETIVADTKWKLLCKQKTNYGISQSDLYQVFAYGKKYMDGRGQRRVILIYPYTDTLQEPLDRFVFHDGFDLDVVPFNIESEKQQWPMLVREVILQPAH